MPNNTNALPSSGQLSLQQIADAFFLYRSYSDGSPVAIDDYYGNLIQFYDPLTPKIPTQSDVTIDIDSFHGKRYALPINLTISAPINNYNVYDYAAVVAQNTYGLKLNSPGIPFLVTVTNNSTVGSVNITAPVISPGSVSFITPGTSIWRVPANVTSVNIIIVGGGGGGGGSGGGVGGGGGGGAQVGTYNNISVTPNSNISIVVGAGGAGGISSNAGLNGRDSSFNTTYTAVGGKGALPGPTGTGGLAGGPGGSGGGKGNTITGGIGGTTLAASISPALYGVGGNGGAINASGAGRDGAVLITFATTGGTTRNTQGTAAMVVGSSSDGAKTFNKYTSVKLINNSSITGITDITPKKSFSGSGTFYVNEGQTVVDYSLASGGGGGGGGGAADANYTRGGNGGSGGAASGGISVKPGDRIDFGGGGAGGGGGLYSNGGDGSSAYIQLNGVTQVAPGAGGGGQGSQQWGNTNTATAGRNVGGGGGGGGGGGHVDGSWGGGNGSGGGGGGATVSYQPCIPGGPALFITGSTCIINNGTIAGGTSSNGARGAGYAIIGKSYLTGPVTGAIYGNQIG